MREKSYISKYVGVFSDHKKDYNSVKILLNALTYDEYSWGGGGRWGRPSEASK